MLVNAHRMSAVAVQLLILVAATSAQNELEDRQGLANLAILGKGEKEHIEEHLPRSSNCVHFSAEASMMLFHWQ